MLFVLTELRGPDPLPYEALIDCLKKAYWSTPGTVTSALRAALTAANDWLMDRNVQAEVSERLRAGISCAVMRDTEVLIAQAGPAAVYVAHHGQVERFPARDVVVPAMGVSRSVEIRFSHAALDPGDVILLCDSVTAERTPEEAIASAIVYVEMETALQNLEKLADSGDLIAMVIESAAEARAKAAIAAAVQAAPAESSAARPASRLAIPLPALLRREKKPPAPESKAEETELPQKIAWTQRVGEYIGRFRLRERGRALGTLLATGAVTAIRAVGTVLQRMLPEGAAARPSSRAVSTTLMVVALAIPIVVLMAAWATNRHEEDRRFQDCMAGARQAVQAAVMAEPTAQRAGWSTALKQAALALTMHPGDPEARRLYDEAQRALDQLDGILRLSLSLLWDFKSPGPHRLAGQGLTVFVLDSSIGHVVQLTLDESGSDLAQSGGAPSVLAARGLTVRDRQVGDLIDLVWMPIGGMRTRSSLLILDSGGLLDYDQGWGLRSVAFGQGAVSPGIRALAAFGGNLYILDTSANQILRYKPQGDGYGSAPENYFERPPDDLGSVVDMAIDGNVYLLYADARIRRFFGGTEKAFIISGLSEALKRPAALTVDAEARQGSVYVADAGASRIVQFNSEGVFVRQFRAADGAFDALEDVLVDERSERLFVTSGGKLYLARLPSAP